VYFKPSQINAALASIIRFLDDNNHLKEGLANRLLKSSDSRNTLIHDAMWELGVITKDHIARVMKLRDEVSSDLEKIKRKIKRKK
jgi:uncharacterized protein YutE (UPF0331/DUF86 family)